uniref:Biogenesis of lysosomal organelles complex 1 subunit 4 n=1 Tax=Apteryx owenii TaxID=8824 RepID=A0A8B9QHG1_APTOW
MLDMIRSDSSQVVNESIPQIYTKATEMRHIYRKIDKLEAFVKMIGNCVAGMEERVIKAETDLGTFPSTFKKILHTISVPSFLNYIQSNIYLMKKLSRRGSLLETKIFCRNHLHHDSNRPSMNLQPSSGLRTIFHV